MRALRLSSLGRAPLDCANRLPAPALPAPFGRATSPDQPETVDWYLYGRPIKGARATTEFTCRPSVGLRWGNAQPITASASPSAFLNLSRKFRPH